MPEKLLSNKLWGQVEPLLPKYESIPEGDRPRIPDRGGLARIIFVLKTGILWGRTAAGDRL